MMYHCVTGRLVTTGRQAWLKKKKKITQSTSQYTMNKVSFRPSSAEMIFFFQRKSKQQPTVILIQNANSPYFARNKEINT